MPDIRTTRAYLNDLVDQAVRAAIAGGELPDVAVPPADVERPRDSGKGDFASTLPLRISRSAMRQPREVAEAIVRHLPTDDIFEAPEIAGPGFINFRLSDSFVQRQIDYIIEHGADFADIDVGNGAPLQVEFVSANPTGPLTVGNGRGAAIGDTLAAVLSAANYAVTREYYVNDAGTQAQTFAQTLYIRYQQLFGRELEVPEGGYPGSYMIDLAQAIRDESGDAFLRPEGEPAPPEMGVRGLELMLERIQASLSNFGVDYDRWYREQSLFQSGLYDEAIGVLREAGYLVEREGAVWFTSSALGESKDNVVERSDGPPTYFATDIAYHYDKLRKRGFQKVIDIWGADHHGHVSRLKTAMQAVGADPDALEILLYQLVTIRRDGQEVKLSKRAGNLVLLDDLVAEAGRDATRYFFLQRSMGAHMDFDLDLAMKKSSENPVYYIQYAHARICSILDRARDDGLQPERGNVALLTQPHELALVREMMRLPDVIAHIADTLEPHELPQYALTLATAFTAFNDAPRQQNDAGLRVLTDDQAISEARLRLLLATRIALARVLSLMGMSAPERM